MSRGKREWEAQMLIQKDRLTIGEVAELTGLAVHTLRYWETEFRAYLAPDRTRGRQRRYSDSDVEKILEIKRLLKEDKYSLAGARQILGRRARMAELVATRTGQVTPRPVDLPPFITLTPQ